jgi:hypothetical protein
MVPMRYDWAVIEQTATATQRLCRVTGVGSA